MSAIPLSFGSNLCYDKDSIRLCSLMKKSKGDCLFENDQRNGDCGLTGRLARRSQPPSIAVNNHQEEKQ